MGILSNIFSASKRAEWHVLKIYTSITKNRPSLIQREKLITLLLATFETCYGQLPSLFDIDGPYGISKGRPVGIKKFNNLLKAKGYEKFYGLSMADTNHDAWILFLDNAHDLDKKGWEYGYQELIIGHKCPPYSWELLNVAADIRKEFRFDYGYITQLSANFDLLNETKITTMFGVTSITQSAFDFNWRKNTNRILAGDIKDVYPINLINEKQADKIRSMGFKLTNFGDQVFLWKVGKGDVKKVRAQLKNELIINTK